MGKACYVFLTFKPGKISENGLALATVGGYHFPPTDSRRGANVSLSASQANATQKLLDHIRSAPPKDDDPASPVLPLPVPPAAPLRPLFGKERSVVGVDVRKGRISLAQRRAGGTPLLEAVQSFEIPENMDWETPGCAERVRGALNAFLPHGGRDADIWVRLPDGQDELRHYRIPKVSPKDRDAIAKMTAIREKPFDEAQTVFDYRADAEVLDKGVPRLPVTAMIANKGAVDTLRHELAGAGVSPAGITSGNIYAQNLFASGWLSSPWEHFAFADIGEDSTRIEIFSGTTIALSRTIKTGLRSLVTALQESHGGGRKKTPPPVAPPPMPQHLPLEELGGELAGSRSGPQQAVSSFTPPTDPFPLILQPESLPLELSFPQQRPIGMDAAPLSAVPPVSAAPPASASFAEERPYDELSYEEGLRLLCEGRRRTPEEEEGLLLRLSQPLGRLARQLERTADHFRNAMGMPNIQGVIVFAPGGCMALALKKFESTLGLPCRPLRFDGQTTPGAATDLQKALSGTADASLLQAIGLSLSSPAYTPNAIMTYKDQKSREQQMRITFLSIGITTVALMLLLAFCGKLYMDYLGEKAHKAELESRIASWPVLYTPDQLRNKLTDTQKWQMQARTLAKRRIAAALMTELSSLTPEGIHLTGMRVTFKGVNPGERGAQRGAKGTPAPEESAVAVLTGSVVGDMLQRESQLAEFLSQLEHSPMVLSLIVEKQQTDTEILSFVATLRLV